MSFSQVLFKLTFKMLFLLSHCYLKHFSLDHPTESELTIKTSNGKDIVQQLISKSSLSSHISFLLQNHFNYCLKISLGNNQICFIAR